ncbi:hypothetical protein GUJ93_ZPchr0006g42281 [Zizania palustris]|uniref:Uncharacterized protein n=1 Tax=Zizania palustris TaxID=103762 RepID=A0A8J5T7C3_ZIZPA|nr:hypothetical protein GUJ93_ZPchr0006g42281 [Zizania palustris]
MSHFAYYYWDHLIALDLSYLQSYQDCETCVRYIYLSARFTKDGVLVEGLFWKDVEKLIDDYNSDHRSK